MKEKIEEILDSHVAFPIYKSQKRFIAAAMTEYSDLMCGEKDKRIKELSDQVFACAEAHTQMQGKLPDLRLQNKAIKEAYSLLQSENERLKFDNKYLSDTLSDLMADNTVEKLKEVINKADEFIACIPEEGNNVFKLGFSRALAEYKIAKFAAINNKKETND